MAGELLKQLIHWAVESTRGGAETVQAIRDDQRTMLDLGLGDVETIVMTGAVQYLYTSEGNDHICFFAGIFVDFTGLNAGAGENTTIEVQLKVPGGAVGNYRTIYTETFLAAAVPVPAVIPVPRAINTQCTPSTFYYKQDLRVTIQQAALGGGWNTITYNVIDAKRGA